MIGDGEDMTVFEIITFYVCPFPELLDARERALGRDAMLDKLIWEPFRDREVMIDDWPIILPSGMGEGDREM